MDKRFNIVYAVNISFPMNVARSIQIVNTCHALAKRGNSIYLLFGGSSGKKDTDAILRSYYNLPPEPNLHIRIIPSLIADRSKLIRVSWNGFYILFSLAFILYLKIFKGYQAVILRELKIAKGLLRFKSLLNIPIIYEAHNIFYMAEKDSMERGDKVKPDKIERLKQLERYVYKRSTALIAINSAIKNMLSEQFAVEKNNIYVIHSGTVVRELDNNYTPGDYICYTGHLYKWKGVDELIMAMQYINEDLIIVGGESDDNDNMNRLKNLALKMGVDKKIRFTGFVPPSQVVSYADRAKVLVLPSPDIIYNRYFISPLKIFEYMSCRRPIVAADLPAIREVLTDSYNAILFKAEDYRDMAEKINKVISDKELSKKIAIQGYKDSKTYSWDMRGERIERMLGEVIPSFLIGIVK